MREGQETLSNIELETERLVRSFLAGDRRAFDRLVLLQKKQVFNLCYRFLGDYDDADDCAQEVFVKVSRTLKGFRFESSLKTWLHRVTVNTCKNRLNSLEYRLRSRRERIDMVRETDDEARNADIEDNTRSPEAELVRKEIDRLIQGAIDTLPAKQKLVVVLRDIEGRSYEEIVEITGLRPGTVKSKLSRARQQLRETLKGKI